MVQVFALLLIFTSILTHAATAQAATDLGNLQKPIEALGALTSLMDSVKPGSTSEIGKLIDENDCQRKITLPEEQPQLVAGEMKVSQFLVEISGPGCPVTYLLSLSGQQEREGFSATFRMAYVAQSAEAKALYDVDRTDFTGTITAKMLQPPGGQGGGIEYGFLYTGNGNSQSQGVFSNTSTMNGKILFLVDVGANGQPIGFRMEGGVDESIKFDFKNDGATLKSSLIFAGLTPTATFSINGQAVTEAEYKVIRDLIKLPSADALNTKDASVIECKAETFRSIDFSPVDAQKWISGGGAKPVPIKISRSCGGTAIDFDEIEKIHYTAKFSQDPSHISVSVELCEPGSTCSMAERAFLPDESASYVDQLLGRYTVVTSCSMVVSCVP